MKFHNDLYYNCNITTTQGQYQINANWIHNHNLDHFQNWQCSAGQMRIYIDKNLDVWSGECHNRHLGHALQGFDLLTAPDRCAQSRCGGCTDDLLVTKQELNG